MKSYEFEIAVEMDSPDDNKLLSCNFIPTIRIYKGRKVHAYKLRIFQPKEGK